MLFVRWESRQEDDGESWDITYQFNHATFKSSVPTGCLDIHSYIKYIFITLEKQETMKIGTAYIYIKLHCQTSNT